MPATRKSPFPLRKIAIAIAAAAVSSHAGAVLVADGLLGLSPAPGSHGDDAAATAEGYTSKFAITFFDKDNIKIGDGALYFGTDAAGDQFLYYLLPTEFVDNTYGKNSDPSWVASTGKAHTFNNLLGSDSMGGQDLFRWTDKNVTPTTTNTSRIDYIADCSGDKSTSPPLPHAPCNSSGFASGGVGTKGTGVVDGTNGAGASGWGNIDASLTGSAASIKEIATSLEYDLKNVDPLAISDSSLNPNWLKEVGYELQFAKGTFDPATFNGSAAVICANKGTNLGADCSGQVIIPGVLTLGDPHVSPPKQQLGGFVPEPASPLLLGSGLMAAVWFSRRRKKNEGESPPGSPYMTAAPST